MGRWGLTSTPLTFAKFPISPNALRFFPSAAPFFFCCFPPPITASPRKSQPNHPFKKGNRQIASYLNKQIYKITPTTTKKSTLENFFGLKRLMSYTKRFVYKDPGKLKLVRYTKGFDSKQCFSYFHPIQ